MNAAGRTLTVKEMFDAGAADTFTVNLDLDGHSVAVDRVEVSPGMVELFASSDYADAMSRIAVLETALEAISNSNDKGSKLTKAEIIALAVEAL